jgi:endonuclease/exonuclease/phosphatase family metal-dependent hydrolase
VRFSQLLVVVPFLNWAQPELHKALSYNIRYDGHTEMAPDWNLRKVPIVAQLEKARPTLIGFQEVLHQQLLDLQAALPAYRSIGVGRDDGKEAGEYAPIFYDTTRFLLLKSGTFWLSPTPNTPSKGWDAALNRICTYALFESTFDHKKLWVFNTHFDHVGQEARLHAAELILDQYADFCQQDDAPLLLMGDFNLEPTSAAVALLRQTLNDLSCSQRHPEWCSSPTFNAFTRSETDDKTIDYFFGSSRVVSLSYEVVKDPFDRSYPSDHFPIVLDFMRL